MRYRALTRVLNTLAYVPGNSDGNQRKFPVVLGVKVLLTDVDKTLFIMVCYLPRVVLLRLRRET